MKLTKALEHKKGICSITGEKTDYRIRLNTEGYISTSETVYLLESFVSKEWIGDTLFVFIGDEVFYEINDYDMGVVSQVRSKEHFKYLMNKRTEEIMNKYFD